MLSNRAKRNIWLTFAILSAACVADRTIRLIDGTADWWNLASTVIITAFCIKFYICYRNQVRNEDNNRRKREI